MKDIDVTAGAARLEISEWEVFQRAFVNRYGQYYPPSVEYDWRTYMATGDAPDYVETYLTHAYLEA